MSEPILSIRKVSKSFKNSENTVQVLDNINFDIYEGETVCLLGYSGCGKTTLLRIVCGFEKQDVGEIYVDGEKHMVPEKDVLMLFQDFNQLLPWKTVIKNIIHALRVTGVEKNKGEAKKKAKSILEEVGLSGFEDAYPSQLSGGMKQRAAFARALILHPKILVMDEPFANLDYMNRIRMQKMTRDMCKQHGITLLFVTHDIEEAVVMSDRIATMRPEPGRIHEIIDNRYLINGDASTKSEIQLQIINSLE